MLENSYSNTNTFYDTLNKCRRNVQFVRVNGLLPFFFFFRHNLHHFHRSIFGTFSIYFRCLTLILMLWLLRTLRIHTKKHDTQYTYNKTHNTDDSVLRWCKTRIFRSNRDTTWSVAHVVCIVFVCVWMDSRQDDEKNESTERRRKHVKVITSITDKKIESGWACNEMK